MAKTNSEMIRELSAVVSTLEERADNTRYEVDRIRNSLDEHSRILTELTVQLREHSTRLDHLHRAEEVRSSRAWNMWLLLVGCILTLIANLVVAFVTFMLAR
ncbi:MAG: hypothetical protein WDZ59_14720 [Pirellulales bacterium]